MAPSPSTSQGTAETEPLLNAAETGRLETNPGSPPSARSHGFEGADGLYPSQAALEVGKVDETSFGFRVAAAMYSFVVQGLILSTIGVMVPYLEEYYGLSDVRVSLIFLAPPLGYVPAAQFNTLIHRRFGQRGIAIIGPSLGLVFTIAVAAHPPFPVLLVAFLAGGLSNGLIDGSWCAWAGAMENANTMSGMLHGFFSLGAAGGPFLASTLITVGHKPWWFWYCVLTAASLAALIVLSFAFRFENAEKYLQSKHKGIDREIGSHTKAALQHRITWLTAAYLLVYVGTEATISGWIVVFMTRARHFSPRLASITSSGFWTGMAAGRIALGFVSDRLGVLYAATLYLICAMALQLTFALTNSPVLSIILMSGLGFFMGPLFPSSIVVLTQRLPGDLHIAAVSLIASVGQVGGALLPYALGVLIDLLDIQVFRVIIFLQLAMACLLWIVIQKSPRRPETLEAREGQGHQD